MLTSYSRGASPHSGAGPGGATAFRPALLWAPAPWSAPGHPLRLGAGQSTIRGERPMAEPRQDWKFGHIHTPDETWLGAAAEEPVLDPDLPIVDPHHHLWQRGDHRYLLDELLADLNTGHNIVATVFLECRSMYRAANAGSGRAEYRRGSDRHSRRSRPRPGLGHNFPRRSSRRC